VLDFLDTAARSVGGLFGGRDWSAPTADQPQMSTPEDAGPLGGLPGIGQMVGDFGRGLSEEGLTGLLDPSGMLDRQAAQRELATMFNVVNPEDMVSTPDNPNPVAGNTVSPEEFRRIAHTYSDIRMDRSDIGLDTAGMSPEDAARFRGETMGDIGNLMQTESGRELINGLAYQPDDHTTTINLRTDAAGNRDNSNAEGGSAPGSTPGSWADGVGTNAAVTYVPGADGGIVQPGRPDNWLPMRSDVTLFHELTHAHHAAYGTLDQTQLDATNAHADDVNQWGLEYQAVGLGDFHGDRLTENTYRRERAEIGATGVGTRTGDVGMPQRGTYVWHDPPPPPGP